MLDIFFRRPPQLWCDGVSRRDLLRVGTLAPLGLSLSQFLALQSVQADGGRARAQSVLLVYLGGGLSHHDSFDLKPEAPEEIRGKYKPIATAIPGIEVGELLSKTAQILDKLTLIRSGAHNNDHHETATNWVLSGRFGSPFGDHPALGAVVAHETGFSGKLPPYVAIPRNPSFTWELGKSAYLGGRFESFKAGDPGAEKFQVRDLTVSGSSASADTARRQTLLTALDDLSTRIKGNDQIDTYDEFQERAASMILSKEAQTAFDIDQEDPKLRDEYGRNTFGQSCLLARRLVERGVRFATVNYGGWDHHAKIFESLDKKLPEFDHGFATLMADMDARGLLATTLVVVLGEFGRTPKVNKDAGRDHWGPAASLLFAGAGVRRGHVIGATDKQGAAVIGRAVRPADVAFTILDSLGIDPRKQLRTPDGRPIEILDEGDLIPDLIG